MKIEPGQVFGGKYKIIRLLGEGGMGAVYEGENARIHRKVAIKILHTGLIQNADVVKRFEREAQAAGRIGSRHIVEVLDLGELEDGTRYMVLEFLEGETLERRIKTRGRMSPEEIVPIMHQLLEGLGAAHQAGIIHRDLKPANVYLLPTKMGQRDFVKILDFGVSKFSVLSGDEAMSMTKTGAVMGTPFYMSPEQAKGSRTIDARSDLYAVGVILYECITGQVPFNAETFNELLFKIVLESPPPPESFVPNLHPAMGAVLRRAMAREPNDRYQTVTQFQQALAQIGAPQGYAPHPTPDLSGASAAGRVSSPPTPYPGGQVSGADPRSLHDSGGPGMRTTEAPPLADSVVIPKKNSGLYVTLVVVAGVIIGGAVFGVVRWQRAGAAIEMSVPTAPETTATATTTATTAEPVASATEAPTSEPAPMSSVSAAPTEAPVRVTPWNPLSRSPATASTAAPTAKPTVTPTATPTTTPTAPPSTKSTGRSVSTQL